MKPKKIIISGWGPYKEIAEIDFTKFYDRGLFLITGATGAGKTTIFDAITYALYGSLSGLMREKTTVRSDFADPETLTFVELFMSHAGEEYHIVRNPEYQRPKRRKAGTDSYTKEKENAILYLPGEKIIEGTKEVNAKMQEILALDYGQFKQISMIAQGEFAKLLTASPKDKTLIFREIFGTGIYERFTAGLRVKANTAYAAVSTQKQKLDEDIRILLEGKKYEKLEELTESDNWNYDAIKKCLEGIWQNLNEEGKKTEEIYASLDKETQKLIKKLAEEKETNQKLEDCKQAQRHLEEMQKQISDYQEKEKIWRLAQNARVVETVYDKLKEIVLRCEKTEKLLEERSIEIGALSDEQKELATINKNYETILEYLELKELKATLTKERETKKVYLKEKEKEYEDAKVNYLEKEQIRDDYRGLYEQADRAYKRAAVGIVARMLKQGVPCPVCGSKEHPVPAVIEEGILSEEELQNLQVKVTDAEANVSEQYGKTMVLKTDVDNAQKQVVENQKQSEEIKIKLEEKEAVLMEEMDLSSLQNKSNVQKKVSRFEQIKGLLESKAQEVERLKLDKGDLEKQRKKRKEEFEVSLVKYGFSRLEDYQKALKEEQWCQRLEEEINAFREELKKAETVAEHLRGNTEKLQEADIAKRKEQLWEKQKQKTDILQVKQDLHNKKIEVDKILMLMKEKLTKIEVLSKEYGYVKDLENIASGNNSQKLVFEQYVLSGYFDKILMAANLRFHKMSGGRYEMSRVTTVGDGRIKDSLEIEVMDYYTGKVRSIKTLSGGESFKASLSLALGLSDVIQAMHGGIRVEALFVDEGFGSLDEESLNQACESLQGLVEKERLIGIISHVPELRERIDNQLVIEKTNGGSRVKVVVS